MKRQIRKYTDEFKQEAVNLALKSSSMSKTAQDLGIPAATLHTWIYQLKRTSSISVSSNKVIPDMATLIEENRRLQKENSLLKEEKEILKKAAAYFAVHQK